MMFTQVAACYVKRSEWPAATSHLELHCTTCPNSCKHTKGPKKTSRCYVWWYFLSSGKLGTQHRHFAIWSKSISQFLGYIYSPKFRRHSQLFSQEVTMNLRSEKNVSLKVMTLTSSVAWTSLRVGWSNSNAHWLLCREIRIYKKPLWLHAGVFMRPCKMQKRTRSVIMGSD